MAEKFIPPTICRLCGGAMKEGIFLPKGDTIGYKGHKGQFIKNTAAAETWWEVEYHESTIFGMKTVGKALTDTGTPFQVVHYRCENCGYLESYAPDAVEGTQ
jgi:predicted nucleic-acid-binding Zn-ribbon protein